MERLDIEALLAKNEQVDREVIKARLQKIAKGGTRKPKNVEPISPYSGRRVTSDDNMKWGAVRRLPRRSSL